MLDVEFKTFEKMREELVQRAEGRYALFHGDQLVEIFNSRLDAITHGYHTLGHIPFLVRRILRDEGSASLFSGKEEEPLADL